MNSTLSALAAGAAVFMCYWAREQVLLLQQRIERDATCRRSVLMISAAAGVGLIGIVSGMGSVAWCRNAQGNTQAVIATAICGLISAGAFLFAAGSLGRLVIRIVRGDWRDGRTMQLHAADASGLTISFAGQWIPRSGAEHRFRWQLMKLSGAGLCVVLILIALSAPGLGLLFAAVTGQIPM
jgi:hypothetical protein